MKDYTLIANNKSKTKITFEYDHALPYKDRVRPAMKYGIWDENNTKLLIKIYFEDKDINFFEKKNEILILNIYEINEEYWFDLVDAYLIISKNEQIENKYNENNIIMAFFHNNNFLNALEF